MGAVPQGLLNWLHGALTSEYHEVNRTYSDVAQTLSYHPNFALRTDVHTFENGRSSLLLNIQGTLPVSFRGSTYAFPISIWVPQEYPQAGPIGFVTPGKDMMVRSGQYVSGEGRIYHPFLANWKNRSTISDFIVVLQEVFAREPPIVANRQQRPQPPPSAQGISIPPPVPPLPPELGRQTPNARQPQSSASQQAPPPPPKTLHGQTRPLKSEGPPPLPPLPTRQESQYGTARPASENGYVRGPPPPPRQASHLAGSLQRDHDPHLQADNTPHYTIQPTHREPISPISPGNSSYQQQGFPPSGIDTRQFQYSHQGPPAPRPSLPPTGIPPRYLDDHQHGRLTQIRQQPPPPEHQRQPFPQQVQHSSKPKPPEDLLTSPFETPLPSQAINITPPPIPPNPQKDALLSTLSQILTQQLHATYASNLSALPPLRAQQTALTSTLNAIYAETYQLNDLEKALSSNEAILHQAMRDADKVLDDAKRRKIPNVDEVLVAPTVVAGQLYASVAEEMAIEESRAVLGKAFDKGRIGGGVWAKQTRSLAREEFLKKALIKKISKGMGLVEDEKWG